MGSCFVELEVYYPDWRDDKPLYVNKYTYKWRTDRVRFAACLFVRNPAPFGNV